MKYQVAELEGVLLDLAVMRATDCDPDGQAHQITAWPLGFAPSTNWQDGGPIIERERIVLWPVRDRIIDESGPDDVYADGWAAMHFAIPRDKVCGYFSDRGTVDASESGGIFGPAPLIAAMRAFVASKFGDEVEL